MENSFRYCHLKIRATRLPGFIRVDPLVVVYTGGSGNWQEIGVTECRPNEWNPAFATPIALPADTSQQLNVEVRLDFYNKQKVDSRFMGTCSTYLSSVYQENGGEVELVLETPSGKDKSRVFVKALEGYNVPSADRDGQVKVSFQLSQTNYWGVSMKVYYEISIGENGSWIPVYKSPLAKLDRQGWGQFPDATVSLQELVREEVGTPLLFTLYRFKMIGSKKVLGTFQGSVKEWSRKQVNDLITFDANAAEDIISGDVLLTHSAKNGSSYVFGLQLVNVQWRAPEIQEDNTIE